MANLNLTQSQLTAIHDALLTSIAGLEHSVQKAIDGGNEPAQKFLKPLLKDAKEALIVVAATNK